MSEFFNPDEGAKRRDEAIDKVGDHANEEFLDAVVGIIRGLPLLREFTTDDVWLALNKLGKWTHEPRALGAAMKRAQKLGLCQPLDDWRLSQRAACHRRPVRVWVSRGGQP